MAHLNEESIKKLTQLCRIDCAPEEQKILLQDLEKILEYVDQLQEVDTENVKPCHHVLEDMKNIMRDDKIGETLSKDIFLNNSPSHVDGMIRVPPIISKTAAQDTEEA